MKRVFAVAGLATAMILAGCNPPPAEEASAPAADAAAVDAAAEAPAAPATASAPSLTPAAPGAPAFAVVYPGGSPKGPPTIAEGPAGPGGMLSFTTDATPDEVVAFYRQRAETAGLESINALNRDDARAYAAGDGANGAGKMLNVIATPMQDGPTDVVLMWSNGR